MVRTKGTPNKLSAEVKGRIQSIVDETVDSLDISEMNANQRIKLLRLGHQYLIPKLQMTTIAEETESDVWTDNFEATNTY